jgi:Methyltransferase domain
MHRSFSIVVVIVLSQCALACGPGALAQGVSRAQCEREFTPRAGQKGKDVIWVPTVDALVTAMLKAANTTPEDYVIDLGSGDGKIPIAAARQFGARALGIEYDPQMVQLAQCYVRAERLGGKVEIRRADIFETDFSAATVLTLYLLSDLNLKLRPRILEMKPGTRVVSNTFKMGDWSPDQFIESEIGNTRAYLWIVPAQVAGTWVFQEQGGADRFRVELRQHFQELQGGSPVAGQPAQGPVVQGGRLRGASIEFTLIGRGAVPMIFSGEVRQDGIHAATRRDGRSVSYVGTRS